MRHIREITADEERFRIEPIPGFPNAVRPRRDPIEPEPVGTLLMIPFRVVGYDPDCDGSLMARLEMVGLDEVHALHPPDRDEFALRNYGLYSGRTGIVATAEEITTLVKALPVLDEKQEK